MKLKIVCVGMHKTGISSLHVALEELGYRVRPGSSRLLIPILKGNFKPVLRACKNFEVVRDIPWYKIYRELDERVPHLKFILTVRDEEAWYPSVSREVGDIKRANEEWIYGYGKGLPKDNKEHALRTYRAHNQRVLEYFADRPEDLLVMNIARGDGWEKICQFLGKEVPVTPFPHANSQNSQHYRNTWHWEHVRVPIKKAKNNFKIWRIKMMGLWPVPESRQTSNASKKNAMKI